jgi:phage-related protein
MAETRKTRPISWIKAALKDFESFPSSAQPIFLTALTIAAEGGKADIAKPLRGFGSGALEIALDLVKDRLKKLKEALR